MSFAEDTSAQYHMQMKTTPWSFSVTGPAYALYATGSTLLYQMRGKLGQ